jgi:hypothetical protein
MRINCTKSLLIHKHKTVYTFHPQEDVHTKEYIKVKVKESRNRPGVARRVPGGLGSQIFMIFGI